jgi:hypothetical protein
MMITSGTPLIAGCCVLMFVLSGCNGNPAPSAGASSGATLCASANAPVATTPSAKASSATASPSVATSSASSDTNANDSATNSWSFVTEPDLKPIKIQVTKNSLTDSSGLVFTAPYAPGSATGQTGTYITDINGNPVWFQAVPDTSLVNLGFRVQTYQGKPVLTTWQGTAAGSPQYQNLPMASPEPGACFYILSLIHISEPTRPY